MPRPGKLEQPAPPPTITQALLGAAGTSDVSPAAQRPLKKAKLDQASRPVVAAAPSGLESSGAGGGALTIGTKMKKKKKKRQQLVTDGSDDDLDDIFGF
jgi:hypothetical protein